jgi:hypothetical protein
MRVCMRVCAFIPTDLLGCSAKLLQILFGHFCGVNAGAQAPAIAQHSPPVLDAHWEADHTVECDAGSLRDTLPGHGLCAPKPHKVLELETGAFGNLLDGRCCCGALLLCVCIYIYIYMYICVCVYLHVCICTCVCVCTPMYVYAIYVCMYVYARMCMHVCVSE